MMAIYIGLGILFEIMIVMVSIALGISTTFVVYITMNHIGTDEKIKKIIVIITCLVSSVLIFGFIRNLLIV